MDLFQLQDTFTWSRGSHLWKVRRHGESVSHAPAFLAGRSRRAVSVQFVCGLLAGRPNSLRLTAPEAVIGRNFRQWLFGAFIVDEWKVSSRVTANIGLRYEAITVPTERDGIMSSLPDPLTGTQMVVGAPLFNNPSLKNFAPRFGLAWDPRGDGRSAIRGGFGIYHDQLITNYLNQTADSNPPFTVRADIPNPIFPTRWRRSTPRSRTSSTTTLNIFDPDTHQPYLMQFNVSYQRALNASTSATVAYVGSRGKNLQREVLVNPADARDSQADGRIFFPAGAPRLNPNFGNIFMRKQDGTSFYDSLQLRLERRLTQGLQLQASYTWSHSDDDGSVSHGATDFGRHPGRAAPLRRALRSRLVELPRRAQLVVNGMWELPVGRDLTGAADALLGDWQLGAIFQMSSGSPFFPIVGFDIARLMPSNNQTRPNLRAGREQQPDQPGQSEPVPRSDRVRAAGARLFRQPAAQYADRPRSHQSGRGAEQNVSNLGRACVRRCASRCSTCSTVRTSPTLRRSSCSTRLVRSVRLDGLPVPRQPLVRCSWASSCCSERLAAQALCLACGGPLPGRQTRRAVSQSISSSSADRPTPCGRFGRISRSSGPPEYCRGAAARLAGPARRHARRDRWRSARESSGRCLST